MLGLAGCTRGGAALTAPTTLTSPEDEVLTLTAMAADAQVRIDQLIADAVLRQVDYGSPMEYTFRFTDSGVTQGLTFFASSGKPSKQCGGWLKKHRLCWDMLAQD